MRCRRKFLRTFPDGFRDETYLAWERDYKWDAHQRWDQLLNPAAYRTLLKQGDYVGIAAQAVAIEARTNLIFSFEKMALRDAVKSRVGAERFFARGLFDFLHGPGAMERKFEQWCDVVANLPRKQTRVLTWPNVTRLAAEKYGYALHYRSRPAWQTYADLLGFASRVRTDLGDLRPRDMIDLQSFLWVQGSDEYPD
jgi:hypothetical protein